MNNFSKNKRSIIKFFSMNILVMINLIFLFSLSGVYAFQETDIILKQDKNINSARMLIKEYRKQINTIDDQIFSLKENIKWLELKIKHIQDCNRYVPDVLKNSLGIKTHNIESLKKTKKRINENIKELLAKYGSDIEKNPWVSDGKNFNISAYKTKKTYRNIRNTYFRPEKRKTDNTSDFANELSLRMKKFGLSDWIEFTMDKGCCRLVTRLPILFASGSAKIADTYKKFLKKLAICIKNYDARIIVNGYTDIDSIHNKHYYSNLELGAARAANIVHELVKNGIKPSIFKISTTGRYRFQAKQMSKKKLIERRADLTIILAET